MDKDLLKDRERCLETVKNLSTFLEFVRKNLMSDDPTEIIKALSTLMCITSYINEKLIDDVNNLLSKLTVIVDQNNDNKENND
jgi:hypothetical protein